MERYHVLDTAFGRCGIAWSRLGVTNFHLPESDSDAMTRRLRSGGRREWSDELPQQIAEAVRNLTRYSVGEEVDLSGLRLDLGACSPFHRAVYAATRSVPWGRTATYGEIARKAGSPGAARAVGHALSRNPVEVIVPCHRILAAGGRIGGFSAHGGVGAKAHLLGIEGVSGQWSFVPNSCSERRASSRLRRG
ncbi:MAG: methylated-DNA--[protein]-cysteine S-methyltransferase [Sphingopyxis terrae]|nr:MAG: methylated-DNA--[protein]-cysteine S-methyltransferase [Sphingopyxis terrae]